MSRAADLFDRLRSTGCAALDELIADREPESLFLDFKRSPSNGSGRQLAADDNKNLSKAISGFGNSSGGVVIWGVDCRRDSTTGNEVAQKHPLDDAAGFATKLLGAISRATIPPHSRVQVHSFAESADSSAGYVAVLVAQSLIGPLRAVATNHYHLRAGSDFGIVSHDVLAGMFGKAPQPSVDVNFGSHPARLDGRPDHFTLAISLFAVNLGAVVSERPYLSIAYGSTPAELIVVQTPDAAAFSVRRGPLPVVGVVAHAGIVLPPAASEHICNVVVDTPVHHPRAIRLDCTLGVLGAPPHRFVLSASEDAIRTGIERVRQGPIPSSDILQLLSSA